MDAAELSQAELARQMRRSPAAVSRWLDGNTLPNLQTFAVLSRVVRADVGWLLDISGTKPVPRVDVSEKKAAVDVLLEVERHLRGERERLQRGRR